MPAISLFSMNGFMAAWTSGEWEGWPWLQASRKRGRRQMRSRERNFFI